MRLLLITVLLAADYALMRSGTLLIICGSAALVIRRILSTLLYYQILKW